MNNIPFKYGNLWALRLTTAKKTLSYFISWSSLHPASPHRGCQAIFIAASGTNFFAADVRRHARRVIE